MEKARYKRAMAGGRTQTQAKTAKRNTAISSGPATEGRHCRLSGIYASIDNFIDFSFIVQLPKFFGDICRRIVII